MTLDEIGDLHALELRTRVNGEVVQEGTTREQIFGVAETVAWLSRTITLLPGDIIATGTPAGVGASRRDASCATATPSRSRSTGSRRRPIVPAAGATLDVVAVIAHCRERLADFKCPQYVAVLSEPLPRSPGGKVSAR